MTQSRNVASATQAMHWTPTKVAEPLLRPWWEGAPSSMDLPVSNVLQTFTWAKLPASGQTLAARHLTVPMEHAWPVSLATQLSTPHAYCRLLVMPTARPSRMEHAQNAQRTFISMIKANASRLTHSAKPSIFLARPVWNATVASDWYLEYVISVKILRPLMLAVTTSTQMEYAPTALKDTISTAIMYVFRWTLHAKPSTFRAKCAHSAILATRLTWDNAWRKLLSNWSIKIVLRNWWEYVWNVLKGPTLISTWLVWWPAICARPSTLSMASVPPAILDMLSMRLVGSASLLTQLYALKKTATTFALNAWRVTSLMSKSNAKLLMSTARPSTFLTESVKIATKDTK